jgi:hypothetical protein
MLSTNVEEAAKAVKVLNCIFAEGMAPSLNHFVDLV